MATRRGSPISGCRSWPTVCPISPDLWPGCWPGSTGPPPTGPDLTHVASVATDAPFLPKDLVSRLVAALAEADADLACAASGGRAHPVFGLWPVRLKEDLRDALLGDRIRKVDLWTARHKLVTVPFDDRPVDPFFNANRPADLDTAAELLAAIETS